jgi:hypothetical protein
MIAAFTRLSAKASLTCVNVTPSVSATAKPMRAV